MNKEKTEDGFKKFLIIWCGEFISSIGSGMTAFGLGIYVWQLTQSAMAVSMIEMAALLPMMLLSPVAGVLADRYDRRLLMILGDFVSAFGLVAMLLLMRFGNIQVWQIFACVAFNSVFVSLLDPAYKATVTDLLTEDEYSKASGLVSIASSSKFLISPVLAGLVLAVWGMELILVIDISTIFVTILAIFSVRKSIAVVAQNKKELDFMKDFKEGWKIITEAKGVLLLIVLVSLLMFYMGFIQVLSKPLMLTLTTEKITGILQTICACGMLVTSILIGSGTFKSKYVDVMVISFVVAGIMMVVLGATTNIPLLVGAAFIFFAALPYATTSIDVLIRRNIENDKQGRAWGLISLISQIGYIVAYIFAGIFSDYIFIPAFKEGGALAGSVGKIIGVGPGRGIGFLIMLAGLCLVITALLVFNSKQIREMEESEAVN